MHSYMPLYKFTKEDHQNQFYLDKSEINLNIINDLMHNTKGKIFYCFICLVIETLTRKLLSGLFFVKTSSNGAIIWIVKERLNAKDVKMKRSNISIQENKFKHHFSTEFKIYESINVESYTYDKSNLIINSLRNEPEPPNYRSSSIFVSGLSISSINSKINLVGSGKTQDNESKNKTIMREILTPLITKLYYLQIKLD